MEKSNPRIRLARENPSKGPFLKFVSNAGKWADNRFPFIRLALLLFFLYILLRHQNDWYYNSIFKGFNLGIHELGHFILKPFGQFIYIAGGTIAQCSAPLIAIFIFYKQSDYFGIAVCFGWLATNLYDVATYVHDARLRELPLVSPFGMEAQHDWAYLLGRLGLLEHDQFIAIKIRLLALISMIICLCFGGWLVYRMIKTIRIGNY